jgi:hypothetical protein
VISTDGTFAETNQQVDDIWQKLAAGLSKK